jgi:hypothetical protein
MTYAELRKTSFAFGGNCTPPAELVGGLVYGSLDAAREVVRAEVLYRAYHELELPPGFDPDRPAFSTVFQYPEAEYGRYVARHGTPAKYAGPAACCRVPWDIDRGNDLDAALADVRKLARIVRDRYGPLAENGLSVAYSGGKGFHLSLLSPPGFTPLPHSPAVVKRLALAVARAAGVRVDETIYHHQALFRLPNSRHPSGLFKRLFAPDDLDRLTAAAVRAAARHPAGFPVPVVDDGCEQLADDFADAERAALAGGIPAGGGVRVPPPGSPVVPKYVRNFIGFGDLCDPSRAVTLFRCAAVLSEAGTPPAVVFGLLEEVALKTGLDPAEVRDQIGDGIAHGRKGVSA